MISKSKENFELLLAEEYVRNTSENIFLTGKGGTLNLFFTGGV
jgi:hypothetical protein